MRLILYYSLDAGKKQASVWIDSADKNGDPVFTLAIEAGPGRPYWETRTLIEEIGELGIPCYPATLPADRTVVHETGTDFLRVVGSTLIISASVRAVYIFEGGAETSIRVPIDFAHALWLQNRRLRGQTHDTTNVPMWHDSDPDLRKRRV